MKAESKNEGLDELIKRIQQILQICYTLQECGKRMFPKSSIDEETLNALNEYNINTLKLEQSYLKIIDSPLIKFKKEELNPINLSLNYLDDPNIINNQKIPFYAVEQSIEETEQSISKKFESCSLHNDRVAINVVLFIKYV